MQTINMIRIYYWDKRSGGHFENVIPVIFLNCYYISFQNMQFFLISCLRNKSLSYQGIVSILREFWMNKLWHKIVFFFCQRHYDRGLIVFKVYYFQIWNKKKEHNIISSRVISSHIGSMYI